MTTFILIADAHVGPEKDYEGQVRKLSRHSLTYLDELVQEIASSADTDFVVQLGDLIEDADDVATDRTNFVQARAHFDRLAMPVLHVIGNHDQVHLGVEDLSALIKRERLYYSQDIAGLHCVVLFSACIDHTDITISNEQRRWLAEDLASTDLPAVIFLHHPLDEQDLKGNVWFEKYPDYCFVQERESLRQILVDGNNVVAVFNGHVHQNNVSTIDGIHYVTIQSLVEKVGEPDICSRAFAVVSVDAFEMGVRVAGNDGASYKLALDQKKFCRQAELVP